MFIKVNYFEGEKPPVQVQFAYRRLDSNVGENLIQISVGDNICRGSVTIPFEMLTTLIANVMAERDKREGPGLVVPDKSIVGSNGKKMKAN